MMRRQKRRCAHCGGSALPVAYGMPGPEMVDASARGEIVLGGSIIGSDNPVWECVECRTRITEPRPWSRT